MPKLTVGNPLKAPGKECYINCKVAGEVTLRLTNGDVIPVAVQVGSTALAWPVLELMSMTATADVWSVGNG